MRTAIKMILLKDAKGLGKAGDETEVSTAEQAEYFEEKGIASRDPEAGSLLPSDPENKDQGTAPAGDPLKPQPQPSTPAKKPTTKKNEKDS